MAKGHIPYRGDGRPNHPERRLPLTETQKSRMRSYGCAIFVICLPFIFFIITAQNAFMGFASIAVILFVLIMFFAIKDAQGIKTRVEDVFPVDKNDPAMLSDYLKRIEWEQIHHRNHPKEPTWKFHPTEGKIDMEGVGCWYPILLIIIVAIAFVLAYFYGIRSSVSTICTVILGFIGIFAYLIYKDSR